HGAGLAALAATATRSPAAQQAQAGSRAGESRWRRGSSWLRPRADGNGRRRAETIVTLETCQAIVDGEHDFFGRAVGVVDQEGPVQALCLGGQRVAVRGQPLLVALAQSLGAAGDHAVAAFARAEFGAALVRKRLFGR